MTLKQLLVTTAAISTSICVASIVVHCKSREWHTELKPIKPVFFDANGNQTDEPPNIEHEEVTDITYVTNNIISSENKDLMTNSVTTRNVQTHIGNLSQDDKSIISMSDEDAWNYLTNGVFDSYPKTAFINVKNQLQNLYVENAVTITVPVWYWEDPNDPNNYNKITKTKDWTVNKRIAKICEHIFNDIYNDPSQPIINISDSAAGTWVIRGKMHNPYRTPSAHSIGAAFDINPSSGTYNVNGVLYGNGYRNKPMPYEIWEMLPESHKKYNVLYEDCPIVRIFKSYGFYWGGDWETGTDVMHLAFLGDGDNAREVGKQNYVRYNE